MVKNTLIAFVLMVTVGVLAARLDARQTTAQTATSNVRPDGTKFVQVPLPAGATLGLVVAATRAVEQGNFGVVVGFTAETHSPGLRNGAITIDGSIAAADKAYAVLSKVFESETQSQEIALRDLEGSTVSLKFPGGTVGEFVQAVLGKFEFVPPIYQSDDLRSLRMRAVEIKWMQITSALSLLETAPPTDARGSPIPLKAQWIGSVVTPSGRSGRDLSVAALRQQVCVISREDSSSPSDGPTRRVAFTLTDDAPIAKEKLDLLLDAISVAVDLDGDSPTFRAKYHAPSGVLIVRGTKDELGVIAQIIQSKLPKARVQLPEMNDDSVVTPQESSATTAADPTSPAGGSVPPASNRPSGRPTGRPTGR